MTLEPFVEINEFGDHSKSCEQLFPRKGAERTWATPSYSPLGCTGCTTGLALFDPPSRSACSDPSEPNCSFFSEFFFEPDAKLSCC